MRQYRAVCLPDRGTRYRAFSERPGDARAGPVGATWTPHEAGTSHQYDYPMRGVAVLAALGLLLMACGGTKAAAPTITTTLPTTLPTTLSAVEGFFNSQGGGGWTKGQSLGPSLYNVVGSGGRNAKNNLCPTSIAGPAGSTAVSLISVDCVLGSPPASTNEQARGLMEATVQEFAPSAAQWVQENVGRDLRGTVTKRAGGALVTLVISNESNNQQTLGLSILARGYLSPGL